MAVTIDTEVDRKIEVSKSGSTHVWLIVEARFDSGTRIASMLEPEEARIIGNALIEATGSVSLPMDLKIPEVKRRGDSGFVETHAHVRSIAATLEEIDEEIGSLMAIRGYIGANGDLIHLLKTRDEIAQELAGREYKHCNDHLQKAIDRIIKAEGLAKIDN